MSTDECICTVGRDSSMCDQPKYRWTASPEWHSQKWSVSVFNNFIKWRCLALWELHGNNNMEKCKKCGHEYLRDFKCSRSKMKHLTGRTCDNPKCGGKLRDMIINFGESLPDGNTYAILHKLSVRVINYDYFTKV